MTVSEELYEQAVAFVRTQPGGITCTSLRAEFKIGQFMASALMEKLEVGKIVGPSRGPNPRQVLIPTSNTSTNGAMTRHQDSRLTRSVQDSANGIHPLDQTLLLLGLESLRNRLDLLHDQLSGQPK